MLQKGNETILSAFNVTNKTILLCTPFQRSEREIYLQYSDWFATIIVNFMNKSVNAVKHQFSCWSMLYHPPPMGLIRKSPDLYQNIIRSMQKSVNPNMP